MKRIYLSIVCLAVASSLIFSAGAVSLLFQQTLFAPPTVTVAATSLCTDGAVHNVTDPNPILVGFATPTNGTVIYGCTATPSTVNPMVSVTRAGTLTATFKLPSTISLYLIHDTVGVGVGAMSQAQCASNGILLNTNATVSIPVGMYAYCESFADATTIVPVTVSWYE